MFWKKQEPKFVIKVKQNRYEKFIIDELRVSADTQEELEKELIDKIVEYMQGWNKVALVDFLGEEVYGDDSAPALLEEIIKAHRINPFD